MWDIKQIITLKYRQCDELSISRWSDVNAIFLAVPARKIATSNHLEIAVIICLILIYWLSFAVFIRKIKFAKQVKLPKISFQYRRNVGFVILTLIAHLVNSKLTLHWEYNKCCTTVAVFFQWKVNAQRLTSCLQAQAQSRKKRVYKFYQTKLSFIFIYFIF